MKTCSHCNTSKSLDEFYPHPHTRDRRNSWCKECTIGPRREKRTSFKTSEKRREAARRYVRSAKGKANERRRRDRDHEKIAARNLLNKAIRNGKLHVMPCEKCGTSEGVQAHHPDHSDPLCVIWLCPSCHHKEHATCE